MVYKILVAPVLLKSDFDTYIDLLKSSVKIKDGRTVERARFRKLNHNVEEMEEIEVKVGNRTRTRGLTGRRFWRT